MSEGVFIRPGDLAVVGVSWTGMRPVATDGPPQLEAAAADAMLTLTLPPQHVAEEPVSWAWWGPTWRSLGGEAPPGAAMAAMSTNGRLDVFVAADDGFVYANRRNPGTLAWQTDLGIPLTRIAGATFVPGTALIAFGTASVEVYGVDDAGRLCRLVVDPNGVFGEWGPVDFGSGAASGFDPGAHVVGAFVTGPPLRDGSFGAGEPQLYLVRNDMLVRWSPTLGTEEIKLVSAGTRLAATQRGIEPPTTAVVLWVFDGQIVAERFGFDGLVTVNLGAPVAADGAGPAVALQPGAHLHAQYSGGTLYVFFVTADGVPWLMESNEAFAGGFLAPAWRRLEGAFPSVTPMVSQLDVLIPGTTAAKRPLLGVGIDGKAWFTWLVHKPIPFIEPWQAVGDWFPPGSSICLIPHGERDFEAFAVASDRTVRHGELVEGVWQTVPADWEPAVGIERRDAARSGPSRVVVRLSPGDRVTLTTQGVLEAMAGRRVIASAGPPATAAGTVLELPWGLFVSPVGSTDARLRHATSPIVSARNVADVWHTHVASGGAPGRTSGPLELLALDARPDADGGAGFTPALQELQRRDIRTASQQQPFRSHRTRLSSLGASFDIEGRWPAFDWDHLASTGRDIAVRTVVRGVLYPFGHTATYEESIVRRFDPRSTNSVAVLHRQGTLHVTEPLQVVAESDSEQFRDFPFTEVEVGLTAIRQLDPPRRQLVMPDDSGGRFFVIERDGVPVRVPVHLRRDGDEVTADVAMLFVPSSAFSDAVHPPTVEANLQAAYASLAQVPVAGAPLRLAGSQRFETHELRIMAAAPAGGAQSDLPGLARPFVARIVSATVGLPAVRKLTQQAKSYTVKFNDAYRAAGNTAVLLETVADQIGVSFQGRADMAGGLAVPSFAADAISGAGEPIKRALAGAQSFDPRQLFDPDAKLLGIVPLRDVIEVAASGKPPSLSSLSSLVPVDPALPSLPPVPPVASFSWSDAKCKAVPPLFKPIAGRNSMLSLSVKASVDPSTGVPLPEPHVTTHGTLTNFCLTLAGVLELRFDDVTFHVESGRKPSLKFSGIDFTFAGDLEFLEVLQKAVEELVGDLPVAIRATPKGITAHHHIGVPPLSFSVGTVNVSVTDLVFSTEVVLPFDAPIEVELGFASREHPFLLGVWVLGGGGYLRLRIVGGEVTEFACAGELGGLWAFDWAVVAGEVHALLGFDIRIDEAGRTTLTGYLRVGGTVEVFGLVSIGIELSASVFATLDPFEVYAEARIVLEVDLFLASASVELNKRVKVYGDGGVLDQASEDRPLELGRRTITVKDAEAAWIEYRTAFEEVGA